MNWFEIISVQNILLVLFGFFLGRIFPLLKKFSKFLEKEQGEKKI